MIPAIAYAAPTQAPGSTTDTSGLGAVLSAWDVRATATLSAAGGLAAGNPVDAWTPVEGSHTAAATQSGAARPLLDATIAPGLLVPRFVSARHLTQAAPAAPVVTVAALVWIPAGAAGGSGPILTRDTSDTTDLPAFEVRAA